ncbi:MAG: rubredoxin [Nevskiaceae bacterium]|nr:MAG: rubredoxin [Nevskiaceae bacterium]TBR74296.1 MAG: rubredoxin [Nevskiaceae bacterium]
MKKWRCQVCDFIYDEAAGLQEEGIPPGTKFEDLPEDWTCPDCGAAKSEFIVDEE